jgi:hypothetical protein
MTIAEIGGAFGIASSVILAAVWLVNRGADLGSLATKFEAQGKLLESMKRRLDSAEKTLSTVLSITGDGTDWSLKKLKEDVRDLILAHKKYVESLNEVKSISEEAIRKIDELEEDTSKSMTETEKNVKWVTGQVRAILSLLRDDIEQKLQQIAEKRRNK